MNEFKFACIYCGQHIRCNGTLRGALLNCPACKHQITVPATAGGFQQFHRTFASGDTLGAGLGRRARAEPISAIG